MGENHFHEGRSGVAFREPKLFVFSYNSVTVVESWPPRCWVKTADSGCWRGSRYARMDIAGATGLPAAVLARDGALPLRSLPELPDPAHEPAVEEEQERRGPSIRQQRITAIEQNCHRRSVSMIPAPVRALMARGRGSCFQWTMLCLCARVPGGLELAACNPGLAFMLANPPLFMFRANWKGFDRWRHLRSIVRKRQRHLLEYVGLPQTEWAVRVLRKVPASCCNAKHLQDVQELVRNASGSDIAMRKTLWHLPRLNAPAIEILSNRDLRPHVTHRFLAELGLKVAEDRKLRTVRALEDTLMMLRHLGRPADRFSVCSLRQLQEAHDQLCHDLNITPWQLAVRRWGIPDPEAGLTDVLVNRTFPSAPVAGTEAIVPIQDSESLARWGHRQHNCVRAYAESVLRGDVFIYSVLEPEEATLSVTRRQERWVLQQLAAAGNRPVKRETREAVLQWLNARQGPHG